MSEVPVSVASAVLPPEPPQLRGATSPSLKRPQSSESFPEHKRRRISQDESAIDHEASARSPPQTHRTGQLTDRRRTGQLEERKRGQRLFGALLGTLSQSSSSTANKRRTDIETKQRTKLKEQTEEENERRKATLDDLMVQRQREQKTFDAQSLKRRHQNLLAQAHFLQTKAEPKLYYKPWELLSSEDTIIKDQLEETQDLIDSELRDIESPMDRDSGQGSPQRGQGVEAQKAIATADEEGANGRVTDSSDPVDLGVNGTIISDVSMGEASLEASELPKQKDANQDDGGDIVEGEEDTVIY